MSDIGLNSRSGSSNFKRSLLRDALGVLKRGGSLDDLSDFELLALLEYYVRRCDVDNAIEVARALDDRDYSYVLDYVREWSDNVSSIFKLVDTLLS